jgi:hypothetical protein
MTDHELFQLLHILLGKRLKSGLPVLVKEGDSAVVGAILATGNFLESGRGDASAESGSLLSQSQPEVGKIAQGFLSRMLLTILSLSMNSTSNHFW